MNKEYHLLIDEIPFIFLVYSNVDKKRYLIKNTLRKVDLSDLEERAKNDPENNDIAIINFMEDKDIFEELYKRFKKTECCEVIDSNEYSLDFDGNAE